MEELRILPYEEKFREGVATLHSGFLEAITDHPDVLPEAYVAAVGKRVIACGVLKKGPGYLAAEKGKMPPFCKTNPIYASLYADFKAVTGDDLEVEASAGILEALQNVIPKYRKLLPEAGVHMALFANEKREAYCEFLEMFEFTEKDRMISYERDLENLGISEEGEALANRLLEEEASSDRDTDTIKSRNVEIMKELRGRKVRISWLDLSDPETLDAYLTANGQSFGAPDSGADLLFRSRYWGAKVLAATEAEGGKVIAAVSLWRTEERGYTEDVFCIPEYRRQGLTGSLLELSAMVLKTQGCTRACLNTYEEDEPARKLYEKLGYREVGTLIEYHYGEDL